MADKEGGKGYRSLMKAAIDEAKLGFAEGGVPIGSVLVRDGKVIGKGRNRRVQEGDPTSHAEIDCLRKAGRIGSYADTTLYSTLMPCYLCAGAIVQFGIRKVVVAESESFSGAEQLMREHGVEVINLDIDECKKMMKDFIEKKPDVWNEDIGK